MFLNYCPWNLHTLAWRSVSYRLRIRQGIKVITCVQVVTHTAFTIYVCAICRLFYLYQFSVWFWHLRVYLLLERRSFRLKLLEDIPLSRVQIIHIRTIIDHRVYIPACLLAASSSPCQAGQHPYTSVCFFRSSHSALECPPCQWLQLLWSYTDNIYYWFTLCLACS
jgi:hypothetical protein